MDVVSFVDVHVDDLLLVLINVLGPFSHTVLIVPTGRMHSGGMTFYLMS